jgi:hypothetical protein
MRSSIIKWIAGSVAFFLPTIYTVLAASFPEWSDRSMLWGSLALAAIIPPVLVLSSKMKWRIAVAFGLWVLLAAQFCLILVLLLAGFRE